MMLGMFACTGWCKLSQDKVVSNCTTVERGLQHWPCLTRWLPYACKCKVVMLLLCAGVRAAPWLLSL